MVSGTGTRAQPGGNDQVRFERRELANACLLVRREPRGAERLLLALGGMCFGHSHTEAIMNMRNVRRAFALVGAVGLSLSCAPHRDVMITRTATAPEAPVVATTSTRITTTTTPAKPVSQGLGLSDQLIKACGIQFDSVDDAPKFDFDKSYLSDQDKKVLVQVAQCVTTGPLKGRGLQLVGRADPRGEVEYNMTLGEHRASAVEEYLKGLGVPSPQMTETSRGKLDATGTDEASWARDRRVDLDLR
jgi:peptidoglycan-associated lipoprotein